MPSSRSEPMPPCLDWNMNRSGCDPLQAGGSREQDCGPSLRLEYAEVKVVLPPSDWRLQRAGLCLPPWTGVCRDQAVPPCSNWGSWGKGSGWAGFLMPHLLRKVRLRVEESICRLCCRSSFCSSSRRCSRRCTCMAWGGRGSPTPPGL